MTTMPSRLIITVAPANSTDRPAVPTAVSDGISGVVAVGEGVAVAGDDEQRVVDAHPDGDHRGHRRRPLGNVDDVGEQRDQSGGDADAEHGGDDRQAHGQQRAEADQQDHARRRGSRRLRTPTDPCSAFCTAWPASSIWTASLLAAAARVEQLLGDVDGHVPGVQLQRGVGDGAVLGDLALAALAVGAGHGDDVVQVGRLGQDAFDPFPDRGRGDVVGSPDDVDGVAGAGGEALVEEVGGGLGLRPRGPVVGGVTATEAAAGDGGRDEDGQPGDDDEASAAVAEVGQSGQHHVLLGSVRSERDARRRGGTSMRTNGVSGPHTAG